MSILVGIPTHKRPELLRKCLESIARQEGELPDIRVFVADNDAKGKEGSAVVAELAPGFRFPLTSTVVDEPGISAVRNAILDEAKARGSDFIAMIDDDETASPQWLSELLDIQKEYDADLVGGPCSYDVEKDKWIKSAFWIDSRPAGPTGPLHATNNVLIATGLLKRLNWPQFDPAFGLTGGGDKEWFARLQSLGAMAAWSPEAKVNEVVAPDRRTMSWVLRRNYRVGIDEVRVTQLHGSAKRKAGLIIRTCVYISLTPVLAFGLLTPNLRFHVLRKWARVVGRISALTGTQYREYATRHASNG